MANLKYPNRIYNKDFTPLDAIYGPWASWDALTAFAGGNLSNLPPGTTVAIMASNKIVEYWNPEDSGEFVKKDSADDLFVEFSDVVEDAEISMQSTIDNSTSDGCSVVYCERTKTFLLKKTQSGVLRPTYYGNWIDGDRFGTGSINGRVPYKNRIYIHDGKEYYWDGDKLVLIDGTGIISKSDLSSPLQAEIDGKADSATVYTKVEADGRIAETVNAATAPITNTISSLQTELGGKANAGNVYTKSEADSKMTETVNTATSSISNAVTAAETAATNAATSASQASSEAGRVAGVLDSVLALTEVETTSQEAASLTARIEDVNSRLTETSSEIYGFTVISEKEFTVQAGTDNYNLRLYSTSQPALVAGKYNIEVVELTARINKANASVGGVNKTLNKGDNVFEMENGSIDIIAYVRNADVLTGGDIRISLKKLNTLSLSDKVRDNTDAIGNMYTKGEVDAEIAKTLTAVTFLPRNQDGELKLISPNGQIATAVSDVIKYTDYLPFDRNKGIYYKGLTTNNAYIGYITFYGKDKQFLKGLSNTGVKEAHMSINAENENDVIPRDACFVRFCWDSRYQDRAYVAYDSIANEDYGEQIQKLEALSAFTVEERSSSIEASGKFITRTGNQSSNAAYSYTNLVDIEEASGITVTAIFGNTAVAGIACYNGGGVYIGYVSDATSSYSNVMDTRTFGHDDFPAGTKYIRASGSSAVSIKVSSTAINEALAKAITGKKSRLDFAYKDRLDDNESLVLNGIPDCKNYYAIGARMTIGTMGRIKVYKGQSAYAKGEIDIDGNKVYVYPLDGSDNITEINHGLTINQTLTVRIAVTTNVTQLTLSSGINKVDITIPVWRGCKDGTIALKNVSGSYSDVELNFDGTWYRKDTWIYGDSYADYWPNKLYDDGIKNFGLDGYGGRNSRAALASLYRTFEYGMPKKLVWMLGMNDPDSENEVNENWNNVFETLKEVCSNNAIQLIMCTIPNTPTKNNAYKNAVIKASGLPFVDIASAVGANENGSSWYSGMLGDDNVHPTSDGSVVIARTIAAGVPNIF